MQDRTSSSSHPINGTLELLGQRWTLRILWELREAPKTFRALRTDCDAVSPSVLSNRLATLRNAGIIDLGADGYRLTDAGQELGEILLALAAWSRRHAPG